MTKRSEGARRRHDHRRKWRATVGKVRRKMSEEECARASARDVGKRQKRNTKEDVGFRES